jgi:hypothetical protein
VTKGGRKPGYSTQQNNRPDLNDPAVSKGVGLGKLKQSMSQSGIAMLGMIVEDIPISR